MNFEIERKFTINGDFKKFVEKSIPIKQGYISTDPERTVRVRIVDNKGFITIKGASGKSQMKRFEWEKEISESDAEYLLSICKKTVIDKVRYIIKYKSHTFEVDEFFGDNEGLVIAEVELNSTDEEFELPEWIEAEVTGDKIFYNSYLAQYPYNTWEK
jgi:adenylate cyclase